MTLSANTVWEVRTTGNDNNGGGFVTGSSGTDYSQQASPQYALTGVTTSGAGAVFLTASAASDMVGNILQVISGTNFTVGFYQITSVSVGVSVTVDRNICTGVGASGVINIGGALASPGMAGGAKVAGNDVYVKFGTYTLSTTTSNVSGGPVDDQTTASSLTNNNWWVSYDSNRTRFNTDSNRSTIAVPGSGVSSIAVLKTSGAGTGATAQFVNFIVDGNGKSSITGFYANSAFATHTFTNCKAINCTTGFLKGSGTAFITFCEAASGGVGFELFDQCHYCIAHDNSSHGFHASGGILIQCVADTNGGCGFQSGGGETGYYCFNCVAYNNTSDGFRSGSGFALTSRFENCIAVSNGGYGFGTYSLPQDQMLARNSASYNNSSGRFEGASYLIDLAPVVLSADPFTNAASGDFSLNNTAGGGAACRAAGFPGVFPGGLTTSYLDIGAVQHQDSPAVNVLAQSSSMCIGNKSIYMPNG